MGKRRVKAKRLPDEALHPFVLVHGLLGFSAIGFDGPLEYFRGVMAHLERNPDVLGGQAKVYVADLDPIDTIPSRAIQLRDFIQERVLFDAKGRRKHEKVNIIAHSMGGLDARYLIANLALDRDDRGPMAAQVASLTTIGTPHLGTPFADAMVRMPIGQVLIQWANVFSINIGAFEQLTADFLVTRGFNTRMPDDPGVRYFSYAGAVSSLEVFPWMIPSAEIIRRSRAAAGDVPNDGLVPVASATFRYAPVPGTCPQVLPIDHTTQVGHGYAHAPFGPQQDFDHLEFYATLANALGHEGMYFTGTDRVVEIPVKAAPAVAAPDGVGAGPTGH